MKKLLVLLTATLFLFTFNSPSFAGWWIFGQGTDEIQTNYIYINQNSFDESGQEITLFKETLKEGIVKINGKASVRNAKIGAVFVSLDNKANWEKAKLSDNGYFEYIFTPEIGKTYEVCIKIIDTVGKTNDIDATYKKITVTNERIYDQVIASLNNLVQSYQNEEPGSFMKYVSNNFAGDYANLDFAIRKDFNAFDYIQLRTFINNITRDGSGKVYVAIQYIRKVVASKTGQVYSDQGYTEFIFQNDAGVFKVFSMKNPLLFGLSEAGEVATGTILNTNNSPMLLVDSTGNVDAQPFRTAIQTIENNSALGTGGIQSGTFTVQTGNNNIEGYIFVNDGMAPNELQAPAGSGVKEIAGSPDIDNVTTASVSSGDADQIGLPGMETSYAIKLNDGNYMLMQHVSGSGAGSTMKYRLQTNGTPNF